MRPSISTSSHKELVDKDEGCGFKESKEANMVVSELALNYL